MTTPFQNFWNYYFCLWHFQFSTLKGSIVFTLVYVKKTQCFIMLVYHRYLIQSGSVLGVSIYGNLIGGASIFFYKYKKKVWYRSSYWCALSKRLYRRACLYVLTVWRWKHTLKLRNVLFRDMLMHIVRRVTSVTLQFVGHFVWLCFKNLIPVKQFLS